MQILYLLQKRISLDNPRTLETLSSIELDAEKLQQFLEAGGIQEKIDSALLFCDRAATIVKDILNFSRSGTSDFHPTNLEQLLDSSITIMTSDVFMVSGESNLYAMSQNRCLRFHARQAKFNRFFST